MEGWLDNRSLAEEFGLSVHTVRGWRRRGVGPRAYKINGRVMYRRLDVLAWVEARAEPLPA